MVAKVTPYEESRLKRLEENKKRMEALNLPKLAIALRSPKPSLVKQFRQVKPRAVRNKDDPVRRSQRVASIPAPSYKEVLDDCSDSPRRRTYGCRSNQHRRDLSGRVYASDEARAYAIDKAEELQSTLEPEFPSFVKPMLQSHTTGGFWLGLPNQFCRTNLPKRDDSITLVDEQGVEYSTVYLAMRTGLSGGWRGFSLEHDLVDGDAVVFQLIEPTVFKVYIIRASSYYEDNKVEDEGNSEHDK